MTVRTYTISGFIESTNVDLLETTGFDGVYTTVGGIKNVTIRTRHDTHTIPWELPTEPVLGMPVKITIEVTG